MKKLNKSKNTKILIRNLRKQQQEERNNEKANDKKLIVISQSESRSLEVPFEDGLNIILGGNKTGKSSIIKSIFTTLGCECKKELKVIGRNLFLLICYSLVMEKKSLFALFAKVKNIRFLRIAGIPILVLSKRKLFHEYSNCLMGIFRNQNALHFKKMVSNSM